MKATEQYFLVVLIVMLYKVFQTFESDDEIPKCKLYGTINCAAQGGANV